MQAWKSNHFQKLISCFFLNHLFGCPKANCGPLTTGQRYSAVVLSTVLFLVWAEDHRELRKEVEFQNPVERIIGIRTGVTVYIHSLKK